MRKAKRKMPAGKQRKSATHKAAKKSTRKLSPKALAARRKAYAAKFFPYIEFTNKKAFEDKVLELLQPFIQPQF